MAVQALPAALVVLEFVLLWNWHPRGIDPMLDAMLMVVDPTGLRWLTHSLFTDDHLGGRAADRAGRPERRSASRTRASVISQYHARARQPQGQASPRAPQSPPKLGHPVQHHHEPPGFSVRTHHCEPRHGRTRSTYTPATARWGRRVAACRPTGQLIGWFARKVNNLALGIAFGLAIGALCALPFALGTDSNTGRQCFREILNPGSLVGVIVAYLTQRYGVRRPATQQPSRGPPNGVVRLAPLLAPFRRNRYRPSS